VHTAPVTKISTHWCYWMEINVALRHLQSNSPRTEDVVWRNRFPL